MSRVVIFSPSRFSLYTTTVAEMLHRRGVEISAVCVMRLFNRRRFVSELGRDGTRLLRKIWKKLVLRERGYKSNNPETIVGFRRAHGVEYRNIDEFGRMRSVPVVYCNTLNDAPVIEQLEKVRLDLIVFTGGGLIRKDVLERAGHGVLNCHMGILPKYRGMDVVEWPIIEGEPDQIGVTVHFMDRGVDTGDILTTQKVLPRAGETVKELRDRFEPVMCEAMVEACLGFLEGKFKRRPQRVEDGKQYFVLHPALNRLAQRRLLKD